MAEPLAYKITAVNTDGEEISVYVSKGLRRETVKSMNEEYGNCETIAVDLADIPEGLIYDQE
jgi:predicted RNase H-like nuclease (RuvC/YqgF family)